MSQGPRLAARQNSPVGIRVTAHEPFFAQRRAIQMLLHAWRFDAYFPLLLPASECVRGPMAGPAVRKVRDPAIPLAARSPLATGCLPANELLRAAPKLCLSTSTRNPPAETRPAACAHTRHAYADAIRRKSQSAPLPRRSEARVEFGTGYRHVIGIVEEEEPEMVDGQPPRDPPRRSQFGHA